MAVTSLGRLTYCATFKSWSPHMVTRSVRHCSCPPTTQSLPSSVSTRRGTTKPGSNTPQQSWDNASPMQSVGRPNYPDDETKARCPPVRDDGIARDYASVGPLVLGLPESMVVSDQAWNAMSPITRDELTKKHRDYVASSPEAQRLAAEELQLLMGAEAPLSIVNKYGSRSWDFMLKYWKAVPRYLDVPRLLQFMERRQQDWERERQQKAEILAAASLAGEEKTLSPYHFYMEYVRKGEVCSANRCEQILTRNVANLSTTAYARHSTDDTERWGQPTKESQSLLSNLMGGVPLQWDFYASLK